jgi:RecB family exonuclease
MSASSLNCKYQIFLGLSENAFKVDSVFSGLNLQWTSDLGFDLIDPLQNPLEFECRLLLESKQVQSYLCYPATDFLGQINSPSRLWLQLQKAQNLSIIEEAMAPEETRWDQLQKQHAELPSIANHTTNEEIQIPNPIKLSPSSFESYIKCPFTFAAQKLFLLKDLPDIDLDVDRRTLGQLAHALLEGLLTEKTDLNWTDAQIDVLLKQLKTEKNIIIWENSIWDSISSTYLQLAKKFISAEKKQRESFPETAVLGCEIPFKFDLQIADQAYHFSGVIDRIDKNKSNQLVIYDYKMTAGFLKSYGQWLKVKQIQLLFYAWVIDKKYISNADGSVIGLFYYILKDLTKKGFYINDLAGSLFSASSRKDANLTENNLKKFIEDFEIVLFENLQKIGQGLIAAEPHDEQMCESCHWKDICRAQHLN